MKTKANRERLFCQDYANATSEMIFSKLVTKFRAKSKSGPNNLSQLFGGRKVLANF